MEEDDHNLFDRCLTDLYSHSKNNSVYTILRECENGNSLNDMEMFLFDPGGCFLPHMDCVLLEYNGEQGDFHFTTNVDDASEYYKDVYILRVFKSLEGVMVRWFLFAHFKNVKFTSLNIAHCLEVACDEVERVFTWVSNEDCKGFKMRKKLNLTKAESVMWDESFKGCILLTCKQMPELSKEPYLRVQQTIDRWSCQVNINRIPGGLRIWSLKSPFILKLGDLLDDTRGKIIPTDDAASLLILVVNRISFTRSNMRNSKLMLVDAQLVESVTFKLDRSPIIAYEGDDIDKAIQWIVFKCFLTVGGICCATSHLLIHIRIATKFLGRLIIWCQDVNVTSNLEADCYSWLAFVIGKYPLIVQLDLSKQLEDFMQVGFKVSNERGFSIHKMSWNEMICNVENGVLDPKNLSTLCNLLLASLHNMDGINGMDNENILATICLSFEFSYDCAYNHHMESLLTNSSWVDLKNDLTNDDVRYLAAVIMISMLSNLKRFEWDPGRYLFGIYMCCNESLQYLGWCDWFEGHVCNIVDILTQATKRPQCCQRLDQQVFFIAYYHLFWFLFSYTLQSMDTWKYTSSLSRLEGVFAVIIKGDSIMEMISWSTGMPQLLPKPTTRNSFWKHSITGRFHNVVDVLIGAMTSSYGNDKQEEEVYNNILGDVSPNVTLLVCVEDSGTSTRIPVGAIVRGISTTDVKLENFVWDPGLYMPWIFPILEDKDILKGRDLSGP